MKKLLFCLQTMVLGGVEKELITILKRLPQDEYEVSLLVFYKSDEEIMKQIPSYVKVINLGIDKDYYCAPCVALCKQRIKRGKVFEAGKLALKRVLNIGMTHANTDLSKIPSCGEFYDIAVCYHIHSPLALRYVAEKTNAEKKVAWIHSDFLTTGFPVNRLKRYLNVYQEIVAVSHTVEKEFIQLCSEYREKVHVCHNIVDENEIIQKAKEPILEGAYTEEKSPKILTIGRLTKQKGFDLAIEVARILKQRNVEFKWFFIGVGEQEAEYKRLIAEYDVKDRVVMLGRKDNPYPYLKKCDIYVHPSRHEAYAMVILEAKILNKPIICYNFAGAEEQIVNGKSGRLVPVGNIEALADAIEEVLTTEHLRINFSEALREELGNEDDWSKIKSVFEI